MASDQQKKESVFFSNMRTILIYITIIHTKGNYKAKQQ